MTREHKLRLVKGFDLLAPFYDFLCFITSGNLILKSQLIYFDDLRDCRNVLLIGGGTGSFLVKLLRRYPDLNIISLDISPKMNNVAGQKILKAGLNSKNVLFLDGTLADLPSNSKFDLVITNYYLDLYSSDELIYQIESISKYLSKNAKWLFTDFHLPLTSIKNFLFQYVIVLLYLPFRLLVGLKINHLPNFDEGFRQNGIVELQSRKSLFGLLQTKLLQRNVVID